MKKAKKKPKEHKVVKVVERRRVVTRRICDEPGCKFRGKDTQQGVCFSAEGDLVTWDVLDAHERELRAELADMKKREGQSYVRALEAYYVTAMMNWQISIDECVRLRRDIALLKDPP